jgi:hypothetical protein
LLHVTSLGDYRKHDKTKTRHSQRGGGRFFGGSGSELVDVFLGAGLADDPVMVTAHIDSAAVADHGIVLGLARHDRGIVFRVGVGARAAAVVLVGLVRLFGDRMVVAIHLLRSEPIGDALDAERNPDSDQDDGQDRNEDQDTRILIHSFHVHVLSPPFG